MEKRRTTRGPVGFLATYCVKEPFEARREFGENERDGVANDLSPEGLSLFTDRAIPTGAVILLKFRLTSKAALPPEERSRKLELLGEARHSSHTGEKSSYRIGVRFINPPAATRLFITGCL